MYWKSWRIRRYKSGLEKEENLTSGLEKMDRSLLQEWIGKGGKFDKWIGRGGKFDVTRVDCERWEIRSQGGD